MVRMEYLYQYSTISFPWYTTGLIEDLHLCKKEHMAFCGWFAYHLYMIGSHLQVLVSQNVCNIKMGKSTIKNEKSSPLSIYSVSFCMMLLSKVPSLIKAVYFKFGWSFSQFLSPTSKLDDIVSMTGPCPSKQLYILNIKLSNALYPLCLIPSPMWLSILQVSLTTWNMHSEKLIHSVLLSFLPWTQDPFLK